VIEEAIGELIPIIGTTKALSVVGTDRATWYRCHRQSPAPVRPERIVTPQPRALSPVERKQIKATLESEEFVDEAPATMYRVLHEHDEVRERRRQATHPAHKKPELIATGPNSVWSWDITKLHGP
jgi:putative transposase